MADATTFEGWAIVELMGHRRLAGRVSEQQIAGAAFLRLDIPSADDEAAATQFYAPAAVYAITPTDEATARLAARSWRPAPVQRWELPLLEERAAESEDTDSQGRAIEEAAFGWSAHDVAPSAVGGTDG